MSPDKRPGRRAARKPTRKVAVRLPALDPGPPYQVRWHPQAASERDASWPPAEHAAIFHAAQKLEAEGARLGHPHTSAVQGEAGKGLRELRPRGGRSRWRPIYRQVAPDTFVILAVAPEAEIDRAGFDAAVARARRRLDELDAE
jgi:hypothetical protein